MQDPVIIDLNNYLSSMERAEEEADSAELELWNERMQTALRILAADKDDKQKARMLIAWVEEEIEEWQDAHL